MQLVYITAKDTEEAARILAIIRSHSNTAGLGNGGVSGGTAANVLGADGFLQTGDLATLDEPGYLRIVDRKKDMIVVSGFKVFEATAVASTTVSPYVARIDPSACLAIFPVSRRRVCAPTSISTA